MVLIAALGMYIMSLTLGTALSLRLAVVDPAAKETSYGMAVSISSLLLLVTIPPSRALSDRTAGRFGRRRPWIIGGLVAALLAAAVIGTVPSTPPVIVAAYAVALVSAQAAFNAYAVIPIEALPDNKRARVMGAMGMAGALAMSAGSYLAAWLVDAPLLMMCVPVLLALVCSIPLLVLFKDPAKTRAELPPLDLKGGLAKSFLVDPRKHPQFRLGLGFTIPGRHRHDGAVRLLHLLPDGRPGHADRRGRQERRPADTDFCSRQHPVLYRFRLALRQDRTSQAVRHRGRVAHGHCLGARRHGNVFRTIRRGLDRLFHGSGYVPHRGLGALRCCPPGRPGHRQGYGRLQPRPQYPQHHRSHSRPPAILAIGSGHNYGFLWFAAAALCALGSITVTFIKGVR